MAVSAFDFNYNSFKDSKQIKEVLAKELGTRVNSYGVGSGYCLKWVRLFIENVLKWSYNNNTSSSAYISAWHLFANIADNELTYYDTNAFGKESKFTNEDMVNIGTRNGSLVFGFHSKSKYLRESINVITTYGTQEKINNLTNLRNKFSRTNRLPFNPISHIGIFYNNQFFHLVKSNSVMRNPTGSFYPVAYWNCIETFINEYDANKS